MGFIRRLIGRLRKSTNDPLDIVSEFWEANFKKEKKRRFFEIDEQSYRSEFKEGVMSLALFKQSFFAWVNDALYRYRDVVIDGDVSFDSRNGYSSSGFLFRYAGEGTYYYFLVSNRGYFRFDVVFNGKPIKLIGWTPISAGIKASFSIRIIAHGTTFVFCINEQTVAEIEDETIDAGGIAFAGQNYDEQDTAVFYLSEFILESRPYNVEAQYVRWKELFPISPQQRLAFAESLYNVGHYNPAVIQFKKAEAHGPLSMKNRLRFGECLIRLELYDQVITVVDPVLEEDSGNTEGILLKADALYSLERLVEAREFISGHIDAVRESSVVWNLWGNVEYTLGEVDSAAEKYDTAAELDPETPIFAVNAGKSYRRAGNPEQAVKRYTDGAVRLFRQEAFDDLTYVLDEIEEIDPENVTAKSIRGKVHFANGEFLEAGRLFYSLIDRGAADASIYYCAGILKSQDEDRQQALEYFREAARLESDFYLYWFKLAETQLALGLDPKEALENALACGPEDPWVYNFAGLTALEKGDFPVAERYLRTAYEKDEAEADVCINLSHALWAGGNSEEALGLLEGFPEGNCAVWNQLGNMYADMRAYDKAAAEYEKCIAEDPENLHYLENAASVYIEMDKVPQAEELLRRGLELEPTSQLYNLMGNVAVMLGEYTRAEEAYRAGLELDAENQILRCNYADMLYSLGNYTKAQTVLKADPDISEIQRGAALLQKIADALEIHFHCTLCGREWVVPRDVPEQGTVRFRGEPPDESPAGECPQCGVLYCVECAKEHLEEGRFVCEKCGAHLKLLDERIKYLVSRYI